MNKFSAAVMLLAVAGLSSAGLSGIWPAKPTLRGGVFEPARAAPEFSLQGSDGAPVSLARFRGKVVILEFGFSHCEKVCPVTLGTLTNVFDELGGAARGVQLVFVTVDPERDDARRLRDFLAIFDASFVGVTGSKEQLAAVQRAYGVLAVKEPAVSAAGYGMHHSSSLYLIDRRGALRALIPFGTPLKDIVHDVRVVLDEAD